MCSQRRSDANSITIEGNSMKKYLSITLLISIGCFAADPQSELLTPNSIITSEGNSVKITPKTILAFSPELPETLRGLDRKEINTLLTEHNLNPSSPQNWPDQVEHLKEQGCYAKVSCSLNRNISAAHSYPDLDGRIWNDMPYRAEQFARAKNDGVLTYQNASRLAFALIAQQEIEKRKLNLIGTPETSLYSTDGSSVDDNHTVIFQQAVTNAKPLKDKLSAGDQFSLKQIEQLCTFIEATGFWNPANNILVDNSGKLWCFGQQPNNSRPKDFYYQADYRYHGNIVCGYKDEENGLKKIFVDEVKKYGIMAWGTVPPMWAQIIVFARNSPTFKNEKFSEPYRTEMLNFIKSQEDIREQINKNYPPITEND